MPLSKLSLSFESGGRAFLQQAKSGPITGSCSCSLAKLSLEQPGRTEISDWKQKLPSSHSLSSSKASAALGSLNWRDKASAFPFRAPGRYFMVRSKGASWAARHCSTAPTFAVSRCLRGLLSVYRVQEPPNKYSLNFSDTVHYRARKSSFIEL